MRLSCSISTTREVLRESSEETDKQAAGGLLRVVACLTRRPGSKQDRQTSLAVSGAAEVEAGERMTKLFGTAKP